MAYEYFPNNAETTITDNPLTSGATTVNVTALPTSVLVGSLGQFRAMIYSPASPTTTFEIVLVTNVGGTGNLVWTITRAVEGPAAQSHATGQTIRAIVTDAGLRNNILAYILIQDQKAQNTAAGAFTSGAWRTRTLNTEVSDVAGLATISSNQVTLQPGTYRVEAQAEALQTSSHQLRLQDITNTATLVTGVNAYANVASTVASVAVLVGRFTIAAATVVELQHRCATTGAFGDPCNFGTEVYASICFFREP